MKITILNGSPAEHEFALDAYLLRLQKNIIAKGHTCENLILRDLDADFCTGCWACWVKTPGLCVFKDDSHDVCRAVINADFVLFASPVIMGFFSGVMKKFMDKLIPLVHPYVTVDRGEAHHWRRYKRRDYPLCGLLLEKTPETDVEDLEIIQAIHNRTMLNLKTKNVLTMLSDQPVEEVADAILRV